MMQQSSFYKLNGDWCFDGTDNEMGYNFIAEDLREALKYMNNEGWELANVRDNPKYDDGKEYIVVKGFELW